MKLYVVRHAEPAHVVDDPLCGLTEQGFADARKIGQFLQAAGTHITHIMHSDKLRAQQTASSLADSLNIDHITETDNLLRSEADVMPLIDMVNTWTDDTLLVGHLPFLSRFVSGLVLDNPDGGELVTFAPCTVVCLGQSEDRRWHIDWMVKPRLLPRTK